MVMLPFGKTCLKIITREIWSSKSRFLAIFAIIALGVGFLSGLLATRPDMELSVDRYFRATNTMDLFIKGSAGLTGEDAEALRALPEVEALLPGHVMDTLLRTGDDEILTGRIYGLPLDQESSLINRMELLEGYMPVRDDECLVQEGGGSMRFLRPGTKLQVTESAANDETPDIYLTRNFTVTGVVRSPLFLSMEREPSTVGNGRLGTVIYVYDRCFNMDVYTDFFVTLRGTDNLRAFSEAYHNFVSDAAEKIDALGKIRSRIRREDLENLVAERTEELFREAYEELASGRALADRELAAARKALDEGWERLAEGEDRLDRGAAELAAGRERLMAEEKQAADEFRNAETQLSGGEKELYAARQILNESKAQLDAAQAQVERTRKNWLLMLFRRARDGVAQYDQGLAEYREGLRLVDDNERELLSGRRGLEEGRITAEREFRKAWGDIAAADTELQEGFAETAQARRVLEAGEAELARQKRAGEEKIRKGELEIEEGRRKALGFVIPEPEWYVLDRNFNVGYVNFKMNAAKIADISRIFPLFFMLVVALVSLTTMTRMVEEERLRIGVLKALGYQKRIISVKYILYCLLTGILGSLAGMALGFHILPVIVYQAFGTMFHLPPAITEFNWPLGLFISSLIVGSTLIATIAACFNSMQEKPSALLRPRAPKPGKRIFLEYIPFIWKPLKFTYKVSARNLIRQKKHFFMTIMGISGCTALILAGFGLRDSLKDIAQTQYQEIFRYDLKIELHKQAEWDKVLENFLVGSSGGRWIAVHAENAYMIYGNERTPISVITPGPGGNLKDYITLRDRKKGGVFDFGDKSAVLAEKPGEAAGLSEGDLMVLEDSQGKYREIALTGFTENYVGAYCYLGQEAYRGIFGMPPEYETLLVRTGVWDLEAQDKLLAEILESNAVHGAEFTSQIQRSYSNLLHSIDYLVLILICAAGGLAMIVLYNLTNININERSRELATLRVLGFHRNESAFYIFREITILSILGASAGLVLGAPLHRFIISVAENPDLMFGRTIAPLSYVISALATIGFSILVDLMMLSKISGIKMAESMKAGE